MSADQDDNGSDPKDSKGMRVYDRVTINKEFGSFDAFIQEYITNISQTGVFIRAHQPLPVGTKVNLHFTVIMDDIETVEGVGEVVRVEKDGMGVVFRELSQYSKGLIEKLLVRSKP
jgi:PilZ domain